MGFEIWDQWVWFAGAALALATTVVSLVYLLGSFLLNDKMKTWAKMELVEIFYSAVIISFGIGAITVMDDVVQGALGVSNVGGGTGTALHAPCGRSATSAWVPVVSGGTKTYQCLDICGDAIAGAGSVYEGIDSCHMRLGIWYLREVFNEAKDFAFDIYTSYIETSMLAELSINIEFLFEMAGFFTFTPWRGFFTMGNTMKALVFDWAMKIMMLTKFQEILLRFVATALFPALFVIGALLRTFMFTRRLGGLLLAMAIALYFIFPAFYAFGALVMLDIKNALHDAWMANDDANPHGIPDPPVSKTMYLTKTFAMLGGAEGFSTLEAQRQLSDVEAMGDDEFYESMERGRTDDDQSLIPSFDITSNEYADRTDEEKEEIIKSTKQKGDDWFGAISKESRYDQMVDFAWEPNGPVDIISRITFWSVFFALFSVIGTIAAVRSLSITFGGDIEIAGLTRLI